MLINSFVVFFRLYGLFEASLYAITFGQKRRRGEIRQPHIFFIYIIILRFLAYKSSSSFNLSDSNKRIKHAIKQNLTLEDLDNEDRKQKPPYFRNKTHKMHEIWLPRVGYIPWGLDTFYLTMWFLHSATHSLLFRSFDWTMFTSAC